MNKRKVPKIRFKGFHDDWEQRKLGDIYVERNERGNTELDILSVSIHHGISKNELGTDELGKSVRRSDDKSLYKHVYYGDLVFNMMRAWQGAIGVARNEGMVSPAYISAIPDGSVFPEYMDYCLRRKCIINQINNLSYGVTDFRKRLYWEPFTRVTIMIPSVDEQRKITDVLSRLDHLITLHQKKCFEWKMSGFSRVSISWEQRKFDEAFIERRDKTEKENEDILLSCAINGMFLNSELFGHFRGTTTIGYLRVKKNNLILSAQNLHLGNANVNLHFEHGIISPAYKVYDLNNCNPEFVQSWVKRDDTKKFFLAATTEGASQCRKNIEWETLGKQTISMPSMDEQKRVGSFFSQLDHLITLHQRKLELLKRLKNSLINRCFTGEKITMSKLILYHGSPNRVIVPKFGYGEDRHDYGRGFYLTENLELAKEWAVCRPDETNGWVHKYELEMDGLNILDFQKYDVLSWLAELMKHRDAADSRRYKMLAQKFIEKYGIDTCGYDVITGWRANASYFYIAKEFVRDNIDIEILEELLSLGGLGIQFCIKSERAFAQLSEVEQDIMSVDYSEFNDRYNERDINARNKMRALVDSDANKVTHVFSTLFER